MNVSGEKSYMRKLRHPPEEPLNYGHLKKIKSFKTVKQNRSRYSATLSHFLETRPGCEETQEESIRTGPQSVVANGVARSREKKMKLTTHGERKCDVNGHVHHNDTQSSR
ncbi:hypothetical protein TNCV_3990131 [Trichonephila clavipes]|uniref:Uncharacterized protein n=1 Tax=Trichonephila clavipes TaxID=2585209 RepID=A0A8X6SVV1_TRICX|nr:hypothetical protein TNCV_3990131 [Trichonephila clavipes]